MLKELEKLINIPSPSGFEENIAEYIVKKITPFADKVYIDVLGNVIARKTGKGAKVMLSAHMDELGLISTYADEQGFIRFSVLGSPDLKSYVSNKVSFSNGVSGVLGYEKKCELKDFAFEKCFIDIGATTKEQALELVPVGTVAVINSSLIEQNNKFIGKGLDDKIGVLILIEVMKKIAGSPNDLSFVFTVQEELGLRGAKTAAFGIEPDYALNVDVTSTGDISTGNKYAVNLGKGVAIKIKDKGIICHKKMVNTLIETARSGGIPYQLEVLEGGSTDISAVHLSKNGVICGGLSIPARYIHSQNEMVDLIDVKNTIKLLVFLLEKGIKF